MEKKATAIEHRHKAECAICFLIDTEEAAKGIKFHVFDEDYYNNPEKYICDTCLKDIKILRKLCHEKINDPRKSPFENFEMSFECLLNRKKS